ncbi:MAG: phage portal protein [Deltaproteobacteria bacterium]|nr:phage portal protein [Deltaproteobacteria bacterium]
MTREELEKTHKSYAASLEEWRFYLAAYFGGRLYREGDYLLQHPFESAANYARRKEISYYYNYCGPIVDIFVSHIFRRDAQRAFGALSSAPLFTGFLQDADLEGNTLRHFMRDAARYAAVYGRVSIVVDKPAAEAATRQEAMDAGLRPYLTLVTPENLLDWSYERDASGRPALSAVKIRESEGTYRIWTRDGWELWRLTTGGDCALMDSGWHGLNEVPIVTLYNKRAGPAMQGISDIRDIADINKNIYYLCSDAKEIIENTAFPMLAQPYARGEARGEREVGPHNIIQFDPNEPNSKPYWLEPPHSSLTEIREWVRQDIAEIYRIARMGGIRTTEDYAAARSGVAIDLEYQQLYAALSEKADNLEAAETRLLELWAAWEGGVFDGNIDYPDDFSVRDVDRELKNAIDGQSAAVDSATFRKELQKKIVSALLPKADDYVMRRITDEIDGKAGV